MNWRLVLGVGFVTISLSRAALAASTIYFLRQGDVWQANQDGAQQQAVTHSKGTVKRFLFSPKRDFLAYEKIVGWEEAHNDDPKAKPSKVPVTTLAVVRVPSMEKLFELPRENFSGVGLLYWIPDGKIRFFETGQLEVLGLFEFDSSSRKVIPIDLSLADVHFSPKGNLMAYSATSGIGDSYRNTLYVREIASNQQKPLVAVRGSVSGVFFPDGARVAYVAVEVKGTSASTDRYGVCKVDDGSCKILYEGPARPKGADIQSLQPSPDGKRLAMLTFEDSFVVPVDPPGAIKPVPDVRGAACWLDGQHLLLSKQEGITVFDIFSDGQKLLIRDASLPIVFR